MLYGQNLERGMTAWSGMFSRIKAPSRLDTLSFVYFFGGSTMYSVSELAWILCLFSFWKQRTTIAALSTRLWYAKDFLCVWQGFLKCVSFSGYHWLLVVYHQRKYFWLETISFLAFTPVILCFNFILGAWRFAWEFCFSSFWVLAAQSSKVLLTLS